MVEFISQLRFNEKGLIPVIAQDAENGEVLMMAWMNREALEKTLQTGKAHYFSRSRQKLWLKGEISGHIQKLKEIRFDCDADTLLIKIEQEGGACHLGYRSCFFRKVSEDGAKIEIVEDKIFEPQEVYPSPEAHPDCHRGKAAQHKKEVR